MFLGEPNEITDFQPAPIIKDHMPVITSKHLVDFAEDDPQVRARGAVFEGGEGQVEAFLVIGEAPRLHVIAGLVIEFHGTKLVYAPVQDDGVLRRLAQIAKATTQVQADGLSIWKKT